MASQYFWTAGVNISWKKHSHIQTQSHFLPKMTTAVAEDRHVISFHGNIVEISVSLVQS